MGGVFLYNHPKHKHLPGHVRGILMNQKEGKVNNTIDQKENKELKEKSYVRQIDRRVSIAMSGAMSLPDTHLKDFNNIWFSLIETIDDISRKENLDVKTLDLLKEVFISEVYLNENEIKSRKDFASRLGAISKIVDKYID